MVYGATTNGSTGSSTRSFSFEQVSINNLSRIEVYKSPTPESPGSALAGGVNFVPRGAFERTRPVFNGSAYFMARDAEKSLHKTPGPIREPTYKIHPGMDFSWVVPVNKRFGFTVSGGASTLYTEGPLLTNTWRGAGAATNGGTLTLGANSVTEVRPDTDANGAYSSTETTETPIAARVALSGRDIDIGTNAQVVATAGKIEILARSATGSHASNGTVYPSPSVQVAAGATLDVSGLKDVTRAMSDNELEVELRGYELADSPMQRDGILRTRGTHDS